VPKIGHFGAKWGLLCCVLPTFLNEWLVHNSCIQLVHNTRHVEWDPSHGSYSNCVQIVHNCCAKSFSAFLHLAIKPIFMTSGKLVEIWGIKKFRCSTRYIKLWYNLVDNDVWIRNKWRKLDINLYHWILLFILHWSIGWSTTTRKNQCLSRESSSPISWDLITFI